MSPACYPFCHSSHIFLIAGCRGPSSENEAIEANAEIVCAPDNGGITLPDGFCASLVVDSLGRARHIAVAPNGDIYVKTRSEEGGCTTPFERE